MPGPVLPTSSPRAGVATVRARGHVMARRGPTYRRAAVALVALIAASFISTPAAVGSTGRTLDPEPDDRYSRVLVGGLAAVARDAGHARLPAGIVQTHGPSGREIAV